MVFEGEVAEGLLKNGKYDIWYFGNSKESGNPYITEEIENDVIKSISGSIASQSGSLEDLGYCHIAKTTVIAETRDEEVVLSMNGILRNQIAIAHLDLDGIMDLKGDAIVGTEYTLQYNNDKFELAVAGETNITVTEGTNASYIVLLPNATANVNLKSDTDKKITFEDGVKANKIYYNSIFDMGYKPLSWEEINEIEGYEYVDLGLPSGLLWATCNIGAKTPEEYGDYFAWGETSTKAEYTSVNSLTYYKEFNDISGNAQYDAATANWGGNWRMPTKAEQEELFTNCTWTWVTQNGVNGYKVASKTNGNYIFLPAAGYRYNSRLYDAGLWGFYWSSVPFGGDNDNAYIIGFLNFEHFVHHNYCRYDGRSVRPVSGGNFEGIVAQYASVETAEVTEITSNSAVCGGNVTTDNGFAVIAKGVCWSTSSNPTINDNKTEDGSGIGSYTSNISDLVPQTTYYVRAYVTNAAGTSYGEEKILFAGSSANGHAYVDLGLSVKWATCNVGAEAPEEYGNYYAWGETSTKYEYNSSNSLTDGLTKSELRTQGYIDEADNLTAQHDAAATNWGGNWRMPTYDELNELITDCTWTWTTQNSVNGYKVTGPSGASIFLPAAGLRGTSLYPAGSYGEYWSSTLEEGFFSDGGNKLDFNSGSVDVGLGGRDYGCTVRPVIE